MDWYSYRYSNIYNGGVVMNIDLIFKIAGVGIIVSVLNIVLKKADRDDQAMLMCLAGIIVVLIMLIDEISALFDTLRNLFAL